MIIKGDATLLSALERDVRLRVGSREECISRYDELNRLFHSHFSPETCESGVENATFHRIRYCELFMERLEGRVLDIGNDKPFLAFYLRQLNQNADITTISFDIPQTPYDLIAVDIECEALPFADGTIDEVLFAEVLEHLWRDPAYAVFEMGRVLKSGGKFYLTTPNPCELHAITCILWQANPNQRGQIFSTLESGHLHLWSSNDLRLLLEGNGFEIDLLTSYDAYGYTEKHRNILEFVKSISPFSGLMGECLLVRARKVLTLTSPAYPLSIFPDGQGVQFAGAIKQFSLRRIRELLE